MYDDLTFLYPYVLQFLVNLVVVAIIVFILRAYRSHKIHSEKPFWSSSEWAKSVGSTRGFLSLALALSFANTAAVSLTSIGKNIGELRTLISDLNSTSEQLALQGRTAISDFPQFKEKATAMLKDVDNDVDTEVKVALFWPMFGADFGREFGQFIQKKGGNPPEFYRQDENDFYHYLFRRIDHDMPTDMLLLDYRKNGNKSSELNRFMSALGSYEITKPDGSKFTLYGTDVVPRIEKAVVDHIEHEVLPEVKAARRVTLKVTENLPVLLFIVTKKHKNEPREQRALLFIGNVDMLQSQAKQGGFYTEDKQMVKVLTDFFASLYSKAKKVKG